MSCPIKAAIELTVHTSCYCILDLLCVIYPNRFVYYQSFFIEKVPIKKQMAVPTLGNLTHVVLLTFSNYLLSSIMHIKSLGHFPPAS